MPRIFPITDPKDPRIEAYRDIRERDLVGRQGLFVAEGRVVVEKLLNSSAYQPLSLLIAAKRVGTLEEVLARLPEDVPVFAGEKVVIDGIAGFPVHRGILAIGRRVECPTADALLGRLVREGGSTVDVLFLSGIANHDNMGGIFRNAAAFGTKAVLLGPDCCDPLYRKAISPMGRKHSKHGPREDLHPKAVELPVAVSCWLCGRPAGAMADGRLFKMVRLRRPFDRGLWTCCWCCSFSAAASSGCAGKRRTPNVVKPLSTKLMMSASNAKTDVNHVLIHPGICQL